MMSDYFLILLANEKMIIYYVPAIIIELVHFKVANP